MFDKWKRKPETDHVCGKIRPAIEMLAIGSRGVLCAECADAVEDALDQGRPIS